MSHDRKMLHPRPRSPKQWRAEVAAARPDAQVAYDAVSGGYRNAYADRVDWFVRLAIEERRQLNPKEMGKRSTKAWVFRMRLGNGGRVYGGRNKTGYGDVFCLFCCEPLHRDVPERTRFYGGGSPLIDHGLRTVGHTTPCALAHLAGLRTYALWGSVKWPDADGEYRQLVPVDPPTPQCPNGCGPLTNEPEVGLVDLGCNVCHYFEAPTRSCG